MDESGNIFCTNNTTFYLYTEFYDDEGNPIDLTGADAEMDVRTSKCSEGECSELIIKFSTANGRIILGNGTVIFTADVDDIKLINAGSYYYDCIINTGSQIIGYFDDQEAKSFNVGGGITT